MWWCLQIHTFFLDLPGTRTYQCTIQYPCIPNFESEILFYICYHYHYLELPCMLRANLSPPSPHDSNTAGSAEWNAFIFGDFMQIVHCTESTNDFSMLYAILFYNFGFTHIRIAKPRSPEKYLLICGCTTSLLSSIRNLECRLLYIILGESEFACIYSQSNNAVRAFKISVRFRLKWIKF